MNTREICKEIKEKYEIIQILGQGKSKIVYLAKHRTLQMSRAIKIVPRESPFYHLIKKEYEFLKNLRHSSIPMIFDVIEDRVALYVIEEYVEGENLYAHIRQHGRFCEQEIVKLGLELIEPLEYLHNQGILHLDLSPANVMMSKGRARIIDFDNAEHLYEKGSGYGSVGFASKEQIRGERVQQQMDMYAVGGILYYVATGDMYADDFKKISEMSFALKEILRRCLTEGGYEGYRSLGELKSDLQCLQLAKQKLRIGVVGAKAGVGVTYVCLLLAKAAKTCQMSVAVFERHSSEDMKALAKYSGISYVDGFMYQKIRIVPYTGPFIEKETVDVDVEILDYKDDWERAVATQADVLILLCNAKPWNIHWNLSAMEHILTKLHFRREFYIVYNLYEVGDKIFVSKKRLIDSVVRLPMQENMDTCKPILDLMKKIRKGRERICGF